MPQPDGIYIAIKRRAAPGEQDGGVSVMFFVTRSYRNGQVEFTREPTADAIEMEIRRSGVNAESIAIIDASEVPADRTYRNAWTHDGKQFGHDMEKARNLHRDWLRSERGSKLVELDVAYQRADEAGDVALKAQIVARKQALRDVTKHPAIDAAQTTEDLKAVKLPE